MSITIISALVALVTFGIADAWSATPSRKIPTYLVVLYQNIVSIVVLVLVLLLFGYDFSWESSILVWGLLSGFLNFLGTVLFFESMRYGQIGVSSSISSAFPVLTVIGGVVLLGETISFAVLITVGVIIAATIGLGAATQGDHDGIPNQKKSITLAVLAAFGWASQLFVQEHIAGSADALQLAILLVAGSALSVFFFCVFRSKPLISKPAFTKPLSYILIITGLLNVASFWSLSYAFEIGLLSVTSAIVSASPFVSTLFAYFVFKEKLSTIQWLFVVMIISGLITLTFITA